MPVRSSSSSVLVWPDQAKIDRAVREWADGEARRHSALRRLGYFGSYARSLGGRPLPWKTVRDALDAAFGSGLLERTPDSGPWPCDCGGAKALKVTLATAAPTGTTSREPQPHPASLRADQLQDLVDVLRAVSTTLRQPDSAFTVATPRS